jgi:rfaE bifunctional protein nucleotidyltransferase chain/domain
MHKIINFTEVDAIIADLRKQGNVKIVFTNGCFDLLHRGHVEYLEQAKLQGDILIVGLNSDTSVRKLKGPGRPLTSEEDRAFILSRLEPVDIVCIFEEETPIKLLSKVLPDVLVKGGDYTLDGIVGRDLVEQNGGLVMTIPFIQNSSTSDMIEKILRGKSSE